MAEPRTLIGGRVHVLAPASEHLTGHGYVWGYHRLLCPVPFDPDAPPLPANEPPTCPTCKRKTTKES